MIETYPNPWNFDYTDKTFVSANSLYKIVYSELNEIAMGAPLVGKCFIEMTDNLKIKIHDSCGGPPAWETSGQLLAIPIWTRKFWKGTVQQIGIVNLKTKELKIYSKTFNVLDFRSFDKTFIYGYDSPIHKRKTLVFDIEKEKIETIIKL
ncbi:hypothetical protein [Flavobacterium aquicola]|uniref:Uncharacterized protein n=1 Tax=Flavobacterium aquicola TaxID=1682742 RepID=A0A3E0DYM0_9FLAO|nr:hypothetical protein [Flavobacterium aquicola]REG91118.1 hypothetical protein C8P67_11711 [Flavobacterium aquicola]